MKREMKVRELRAADDTRRKFVDHQRKVKEVQLRRLDEQIKKKVSTTVCIDYYAHTHVHMHVYTYTHTYTNTHTLACMHAPC